MSGNRSESHNPQKQDSNENNSNIGFSRILKSHSEKSFFFLQKKTSNIDIIWNRKKKLTSFFPKSAEQKCWFKEQILN